MTKTNGEKASIREVYDIANRLESKIDGLRAELFEVKSQIARMTGYAAGVGGVAGLVAWLITNFIR